MSVTRFTRVARFAILGVVFASAIALLVPSFASASSRAGYCSVAGNFWPDTAYVQNKKWKPPVLLHRAGPIAPGTFLDLNVGEPALMANLKGATPAIFVQGKGLTCDAAPTGFSQTGTIGRRLGVAQGFYNVWLRAA